MNQEIEIKHLAASTHLHIYKITVDSIRSARNHKLLVEGIRKRAATLNKKTWKIEFKWVKAHAGFNGNEFADRLAREATENYHVIISRIQKSAIKKTPGKSIRKWQS